MRRFLLRTAFLLLLVPLVSTSCGGGGGDSTGQLPNERDTWDQLVWDEDAWA
jgi:hypothetical protein